MDEWITAKEVETLAKVGETKAREIIGIINKEIEETGGIVPIKGRAPRRIVLSKLRIQGEGI